LSKVELESFLKSFILFFTSISILITTIYYIAYTKEIQKLDDEVFNEMRICSFDLKCNKYSIDFVLTKDKELYKLYKNDKQLSVYFPIPNATQNSIELSYSVSRYNFDVSKIKTDSLVSLAIVLLIVFILSILFSLYTLYPLRNALRLTEEFVKDILHDFNTPLSTLRLNSSMLEKEFGESTKITRIKKSVQTILNLQTNLRAYLDRSVLKKEELDLGKLLQERVELMQMSYEQIQFTNRVLDVNIFTNRDAFIRIIDNLLSNAAKYNSSNGSVELFMQDTNEILCIKDSGKGIKEPSKVFDRFYKEQDRGIGIGLHIVKKLSNELGINITLKSSVNEGSMFFLKLNSE